jgi:hypothetical protein
MAQFPGEQPWPLASANARASLEIRQRQIATATDQTGAIDYLHRSYLGEFYNAPAAAPDPLPSE